MDKTYTEASRPMSNTAFIYPFSRSRRSEFNDSWVGAASWVTNATRRESIKLTQRFAAVSTSASQEQPHTYTSSWTSRLLRRAPVRSEYVIDEEQSPNDPPPSRPHLPTLAALLRSEPDMGRSNGELHDNIILSLTVLLFRRSRPTSNSG